MKKSVTFYSSIEEVMKMAKVPCPGSKIRSKGRGRGLGTGRGKGPVGVPRGTSSRPGRGANRGRGLRRR